MPPPRPQQAASPPRTTDLRPVRERIGNYMAELIVYGGAVATREQVYNDALARTDSIQGASVFAYSSTARLATPEELAACRGWPTRTASSPTRGS